MRIASFARLVLGTSTTHEGPKRLIPTPWEGLWNVCDAALAGGRCLVAETVALGVDDWRPNDKESDQTVSKAPLEQVVLYLYNRLSRWTKVKPKNFSGLGSI